jgi:Flp pilus assembly pilin Flp
MRKVVAKAGRIRRLLRRWRMQAGQTIVEYTLLLAVIGIPMIGFSRKLLGYLATYYGWLTFMETTPLP